MVSSKLKGRSKIKLDDNKKGSNEIEWINKVDEHAEGNFAVIEWKADEKISF